MEQSQLQEVMKFHLRNFSGKDDITDDTIHEDALSQSLNKKIDLSRAYQDVIGWTIDNAGHEDKKWPDDWKKLSVSSLASQLLMILFVLMLPVFSIAQLQVTVGAGKSDLRESAVLIGISYYKSFDSIWKNKQYRWYGKNSTFSIQPELALQTGTEDAFSSITLKATGLLMHFKTTTVAGVVTPNTAAVFHTFPMAIGVETNNMFRTANAIVEAGWVPWYQASTVNLPKFIKTTSFGLYLQGGYKVAGSTGGSPEKGGAIDESEELPDHFLARVKGSFDVDTRTLLKVNNLEVGIVGGADVWYDIVNGAVYHRLEGRGRFYLDNLKYIDLIYQKGSGAPNFNQGDQYGVGLTITF